MASTELTTIEQIVNTSMTSNTVQELATIINNCSKSIILNNLSSIPQEFLEMLVDKINETKTLKYVSITNHTDNFDNLRYILGELGCMITIESIYISALMATDDCITAVENFIQCISESLKSVSIDFTGMNGRIDQSLDIPGLLRCISRCVNLENLEIVISRNYQHILELSRAISIAVNLKRLKFRFCLRMGMHFEPEDNYSDSDFALLSDAIIDHNSINSIDFLTDTHRIYWELEMVQEIMLQNHNIIIWKLNDLGRDMLEDTIQMCKHIRAVQHNALNSAGGCHLPLLKVAHIKTLELYNLQHANCVKEREWIESALESNTTLLSSYSLSEFSPKCKKIIARNNKKHAVSRLIEIVPSLHSLGMNVWVMFEIVQKLMPKHDAITRHFVVRVCSGIIRSIDSIENAKQ